MTRTIENKFNLKVGDKIVYCGEEKVLTEIRDDSVVFGTGFMKMALRFKVIQKMIDHPNGMMTIKFTD